MFQQIILPYIILFLIFVLFVGIPLGLLIRYFMDQEEKQHIHDVWGGDTEAYENYAHGEGS